MNKKELSCYETDASRLIGKARNVVFPQNIEEVQNVIKTSDLDVVPRGGGSGFVGGCVPNDSLVVDLGKMNKVREFNSVKRSVYAEAGVLLKELNDKLENVGFEFPIQPLNHGISTIGGMVATNACGSRSGYGEMRDWIEEVEFVNGRGELVRTSKADLMDVCGMEGITGIIVGVKLRIIPMIQRSISIFQTDEIDEILSMVRRLKLEKDISMLEFFSKRVSKMLGLPEKYHIMIEFNSSRGKIKGFEYEKIVNLINNVYFVLFKEGYYNSEDGKFFFDKIKEFILYLESNEIPYFGHLGSGVIHGFFKDDEPGKRREVFNLVKKMHVRLGEYGIGILRKDFVDSFEEKVLQRVKMRHDPFGKLNKGKIIKFSGGIGGFKKKVEPSASKVIGDSKVIDLMKEVEKENFRERLKDYGETFDSELGNVEKIEKIAREIPRGIVEKTVVKKETQDISNVAKAMAGELRDDVESEEEEAPPGVPPEHTQGAQARTSEEVPSEDGSNVKVDDNLDRPSEGFGAKPRKKVSDEEQKLIDSVIFGNKKKEDKNDNRS